MGFSRHEYWSELLFPSPNIPHWEGTRCPRIFFFALLFQESMLFPQFSPGPYQQILCLLLPATSQAHCVTVTAASARLRHSHFKMRGLDFLLAVLGPRLGIPADEGQLHMLYNKFHPQSNCLHRSEPTEVAYTEGKKRETSLKL